MRRTTILNAAEVRRTTFSEAQNAFYKHCRIKNLRPRTITYYTEDLNQGHQCLSNHPAIGFFNKVRSKIEELLLHFLLEKGKILLSSE